MTSEAWKIASRIGTNPSQGDKSEVQGVVF
jgi:hypothetical protein